MTSFIDSLIVSGSTAAVIACILWLSRNLIITRLTKSVQHEFDKKIAHVESELRRGEEQLHASLCARSAEIDSLRSGALTAMVSRQIALDKRKLEAVEQLWSAAISLSPAIWASQLLSCMNYSEAHKQAMDSPKVRQLFHDLSGKIDLKTLRETDAQKARPFVSPMAWALYKTYETILIRALLKIEALKLGAPNMLVNENGGLKQLIKMVLPHHERTFDERGEEACYDMLEELKNKLLDELRKFMTGEDTDKESVRQSAAILLAVDASKPPEKKEPC